jgi:hypothetical protein
MKNTGISSDDDMHRNEKKDRSSKKLGDKIGPARSDRNRGQSKETKDEPHPNQNQENREDGNRTGSH